jgi:hypothetical protein
MAKVMRPISTHRQPTKGRPPLPGRVGTPRAAYKPETIMDIWYHPKPRFLFAYGPNVLALMRPVAAHTPDGRSFVMVSKTPEPPAAARASATVTARKV